MHCSILLLIFGQPLLLFLFFLIYVKFTTPPPPNQLRLPGLIWVLASLIFIKWKLSLDHPVFSSFPHLVPPNTGNQQFFHPPSFLLRQKNYYILYLITLENCLVARHLQQEMPAVLLLLTAQNTSSLSSATFWPWQKHQLSFMLSFLYWFPPTPV